MTVQDLRAIGELVGGVAVIATLIYLVTQLRIRVRHVEHEALTSHPVATGSPLQLYHLTERAEDLGTLPTGSKYYETLPAIQVGRSNTPLFGLFVSCVTVSIIQVSYSCQAGTSEDPHVQDYERQIDLIEFVGEEQERIQKLIDSFDEKSPARKLSSAHGQEKRKPQTEAPEITSDIHIEASEESAASLSPNQRRDYLIGRWYGSYPTDQGEQRMIIDRSPRGKYKVIFRTYDKEGIYNESIEIGYWGVSGPIYFSIFKGWVVEEEVRGADPTHPFNYNAYKIIKLNEEEFEYQSFDTGDKFLIMRVPENFDFP